MTDQHDGEWQSVTNVRKQKRLQRRERKREWQARKTQCPHLIMPEHAKHKARTLNIDNLAESLLSPAWVAWQMEGWQYYKAITKKNFAKPDDTDAWVYKLESLNNDYDDSVLFRKPVVR